MEFLMAFLVGGVLCLLFQIVLCVTKASIPNILLVGLALGGILTPFGVTAQLAEWGGAGFSIMTVGAGQAVCETMQAALAGNPWPLLSVLGVFVVFAVVGIASGAVNRALRKGEPESQRPAE